MVNVAVTIALLPALFPGGGAGASDAPQVVIAADAPMAPVEAWMAAADAATTTTTAPPPATTVPRPRPRPTTTVVRKPVTTTATKRIAAATVTTRPAAKPMVKPASAEPAASGQQGKATYYTGGGPGKCAHRSVPIGTVITVTAVNSGATVRCTVADRGPFVAGYVIDLDPVEFDQLAPRSSGVVNVRLTW